MSVQVYGCNHVAIEGGNVRGAVEFHENVFDLEKSDGGRSDAENRYSFVCQAGPQRASVISKYLWQRILGDYQKNW